MASTYYLAVDIGASGGRHIAGCLENGQFVLREVYRFENKMVEKDGGLYWDVEALVGEIKSGIRACAQQGITPASVAIDTWGVDYALVDSRGQLVGPTWAYRDKRTQGMDEKLEKTMPFAELYRRTGIAKQPFNTLYQLMATPKEDLQRAARCLLLPEYFAWRLCGVMKSEYTIASTTALLNAEVRAWDAQVLLAAGIPAHLFPEFPVMPGTPIGFFTRDMVQYAGFDCQVVLPASHDTGSAFIAIPARDENAVYLSSGTWSLLGVEREEALVSQAAVASGFTNEGAWGGRVRFLKNIMGLWIIQSIRREHDKAFSYEQMAAMAQQVQQQKSPYPGRFDVTDARLLAPASMMDTVAQLLREGGYAPANTLGETLYSVYMSLAEGYRRAILDLQQMMGKRFTSVNIVGGGSQNVVLNQMTADALNLPVYAGPAEGTALGNLISQMIAAGEIASQQQARDILRQGSFVAEYQPRAPRA